MGGSEFVCMRWPRVKAAEISAGVHRTVPHRNIQHCTGFDARPESSVCILCQMEDSLTVAIPPARTHRPVCCRVWGRSNSLSCPSELTQACREYGQGGHRGCCSGQGDHRPVVVDHLFDLTATHRLGQGCKVLRRKHPISEK
ncbi:hypothetical protein VFPFJ_05230 [Purpureocillium lilacinum]|uniref:Uncharacterized protein n=1 Tax=Purpureocillium lilacinum TaxID=33203 RepID=A0A179H3X8_PURLI|nr:hypothetical protein VFPFJ_05230 [Purpureocillium lilacinum]OAQ84280.1 hypothetical protein VFPBJ_03048 [Purpureocillium lilacinum]OAQ91071.1 hypothetical protein VFPFJ_05230 [Purpureocillium lilacinum]